MEILGVGLPEMGMIVLVALILLGPKDMVAAGKTIGKVLRKFYMSGTWQSMRRTGEELQQLPTKLMREAGLDELQNQVQDLNNNIRPPGYYPKSFNESAVFNQKTQAAATPPVQSPLPTEPASQPPEVPGT